MGPTRDDQGMDMIRRTLRASLLFVLPFAVFAACDSERLDGGTDAPDAATGHADGGVDGLDAAIDEKDPSKGGGSMPQPTEGAVAGSILGKPFILASAEIEMGPNSEWMLTLSNFDGQCHAGTLPLGPDTMFVTVHPLVPGPTRSLHVGASDQGQPTSTVSATFQVGLYPTSETGGTTVLQEISGTMTIGTWSDEPGSSVRGTIELSTANWNDHVSGDFVATICPPAAQGDAGEHR